MLVQGLSNFFRISKLGPFGMFMKLYRRIVCPFAATPKRILCLCNGCLILFLMAPLDVKISKLGPPGIFMKFYMMVFWPFPAIPKRILCSCKGCLILFLMVHLMLKFQNLVCLTLGFFGPSQPPLNKIYACARVV